MERLERRFFNLDRRWRIALGVAFYALIFAGVGLYVYGGIRASVAGSLLLVVSAVAYLPLRAYSQSIETRFQRTVPTDEEPSRYSNEAEREFMYQAYEYYRWCTLLPPAALLAYLGSASAFGWPVPDMQRLISLLVGLLLTYVSLPTVIWNWIEPGTYDEPYPADEE